MLGEEIRAKREKKRKLLKKKTDYQLFFHKILKKKRIKEYVKIRKNINFYRNKIRLIIKINKFNLLFYGKIKEKYYRDILGWKFEI